MRRHVMVVEDDATLLPLIARALETEGYRVTRAGSGVEAMEHLQAGAPDLIVSDIMMPHMDGYALLTRLRADPRTAHVPVIFLTALGDEASIERGRRLGVDHYLVKPFTPAQLLATVGGTMRRYAELRSGGLVVSARPTASAAGVDVSPTGVAPLDEQLGGLVPGRVYLAAGDFGAAKTAIALTMLSAAVARGQRALLVTTERLDTVLYVAGSAGLALRDPIRSGRLLVLGLADGFEQLLATRDDLTALAAEIGDWVREHRVTHVAITRVLSVVCSTTRLTLSAPLLADFVAGLERTEATTILVADEPVTPAEELAEAYLRRETFGTLLVQKDPDGTGRGVLKAEGVRGVAGDPQARPFRMGPGGIVGVDPQAEIEVYDRLLELRHRADVDRARGGADLPAVVARKPMGWRMRDPFALYLRDCLFAAQQATARFGLLLAHLPAQAGAGGERPLALAPADLDGVLDAEHVLCWIGAAECAVLAFETDVPALRALAERLRERLEAVMDARRPGQLVRVATVHATEAGSLDALLAALDRKLMHAESASPPAQAAVA